MADDDAATTARHPRMADFPLVVNAGSRPLHLLMANVSLTAELLHAVLNLDPSAATAVDKDGISMLLMHCAHHPAITSELLQVVLALDPAAVTAPNANGFTPLLWFCVPASRARIP